MARTRYAPDRGLTARMTATMFLLGLVFVGFIAAIIGAVSPRSGAYLVRAMWRHLRSAPAGCFPPGATSIT